MVTQEERNLMVRLHHEISIGHQALSEVARKWHSVARRHGTYRYDAIHNLANYIKAWRAERGKPLPADKAMKFTTVMKAAIQTHLQRHYSHWVHATYVTTAPKKGWVENKKTYINIGYMWGRRVGKLLDEFKQYDREWIILDAIEFRVNSRVLRMFEMVAYNVQTKTNHTVYGAAVLVGNKELVIRREPSQAVTRGTYLANKSIAKTITGE